MLWIPPGFGHGFAVVSDGADFLYKITEFYDPAGDRTILWNDAELGIEWPIMGEPVISAKDAAGKRFREAEVFE
jgi:dTDP-4-dehydrorhamnose 3,5-epimerase